MKKFLVFAFLISCNTPTTELPCAMFLTPNSLSIPQGGSAAFETNLGATCHMFSPVDMKIENPNNFPFTISFVPASNTPNSIATIRVDNLAALNSYSVTVVAMASGTTVKALLNVAVVKP